MTFRGYLSLFMVECHLLFWINDPVQLKNVLNAIKFTFFVTCWIVSHLKQMYFKTPSLKLIFVSALLVLLACGRNQEKAVKEKTTILADTSVREISKSIESDPQNAE